MMMMMMMKDGSPTKIGPYAYGRAVSLRQLSFFYRDSLCK